MSCRKRATRNVLTPAGLALLRRKLCEVHALAEEFGFKEVSYLVGAAEMALLDARQELIPYRGDLVAEIQRPSSEILDA